MADLTPYVKAMDRSRHTAGASGALETETYDVTIRLITPSGSPIAGASVTVRGVALGVTDAYGYVTVRNIPSGSYVVLASWYGLDISPTVPLVVMGYETVTMTGSMIARVTIQVASALNQGLSGANVVIKKGSLTVFNGVASSDGTVAIELPYGTYDMRASYKSVTADKTGVAIYADAVIQIPTGIFIELLGQGLSFAGFALWAMAVLVVLAVAAFVLLRIRKHLQTPPPPPT
jgi:hypothetical protein